MTVTRHLTEPLQAALADTPVVVLHGARQVGKSTLAQALVTEGRLAAYRTLDDAAIFAAATRDPEGLIAGLDGPTVIDEVQRVPELIRAIKAAVDRDRRPGRFLLTGSSDVLFIPEVADALAGRMEVLLLSPFTQGELVGVRETLIDRLFGKVGQLGDSSGGGLSLGALDPQPLDRAGIGLRLVAGGYPEVLARSDGARRAAWFGAYVTSVIQRDIGGVAQIDGLAELPRLLSLLAGQHGGLLNMAELSRDIGFAMPTVKRYLALLRGTHLYQPLPAWAGNTRKRLIKSERVFLNDTGLLAWLLGLAHDAPPTNPEAFGTLLEGFVVQEFRRQIEWSRTRPLAFYYRTAAGREVDLVLEARGGAIVGVEVKSTATLRGEDLRGLEDLRETVGENFRAGVIVHTGREVVPMGERLWALPVSALWAGRRESGGSV